MLVQFSDTDMAKYINTYNSFATVTVIIQTILVVEQHTVILFQCIQLSFNLLTRIVSKVSFNFCYCCWQLYNYSLNSIVFHANIYTYNCFFFVFLVASSACRLLRRLLRLLLKEIFPVITSLNVKIFTFRLVITGKILQ